MTLLHGKEPQRKCIIGKEMLAMNIVEIKEIQAGCTPDKLQFIREMPLNIHHDDTDIESKMAGKTT